jgi:hypothetical protein
MNTPATTRCALVVLALCAGCLLAGGCTEPPPRAEEPLEAPGGRDGPEPEDEAAGAPEANAVEPANSVTPGDVLPPLPTPAPQLGDGSAPVRLRPIRGCAQMSPGDGFKLARRFEVPFPVSRPGPDGGKARVSDGTLELCQFNRWLARDGDETRTRTGRRHHFVAAFPGDDVAAWTPAELTRPVAEGSQGPFAAPSTLTAAGWAALIPTGLAEVPAVAVVSGRFFDGAVGEDVHWQRQAAALIRTRGRWAFKPLDLLAWQTLDTAWLKAGCAALPDEADKAAVSRCHPAAIDRAIAKQAKASARHDKARERLLKVGKVDGVSLAKPGPDPQAHWLGAARKALAAKNARIARRLAVRALVACGEPIEELEPILDDLGKLSRFRRATPRPKPKPAPLCGPLADKPAPPRKR